MASRNQSHLAEKTGALVIRRWLAACAVSFAAGMMPAETACAEGRADWYATVFEECQCDPLGIEALTELWEDLNTPEERDGRYFDPYGWQFTQDPFRMGLVKHDELLFLPSASTHGSASGSLQVTEFYSWIRFSELIRPNVLLNWTGNADGIFLSGPQSPSLPGQLGRLSLDLEAVLLGYGETTTAVAFHPQLVTDDQDHLTDKALTFDGRVVNTYRPSPEWMFVYGLAFWDRVDVLVIPEIGAVWTPDDRWELRILFPRSQISYRMGDVGGGQLWLTSVVEYSVQAYQVGLENPSRIDRMQSQDWRFLAGVRQDFFDSSWAADVGIVFDRQISFRGPTADFRLGPTALFRIGIWF